MEDQFPTPAPASARRLQEKTNFLFIGPTSEANVPALYSKITKLIQSKGPLRAAFLLGLTDPLDVPLPAPPCPVFILSTPTVSHLIPTIPENTTILSKLGFFTIDQFGFAFTSLDETTDDVSYEAVNHVVSLASHRRSCDFFLSTYWPSHVLDELLSSSNMPQYKVNYSYVSAILARALCPRYIFTIGKSFYSRAPFANPPFANQPSHPTQFFALAPEPSPNKAVYFISTISLAEGAMISVTKDVSNNPFTQIIFNRELFMTFHDNTIIPPRPNSTHSSQQRRIPPTIKVNSCWFCLANPKSNPQLIVSCGDFNYVSYPKGALTMNHLLIIPIHHIMGLKTMNESGLEEVLQYLECVRAFYDSLSMQYVAFETVLDIQSRNLTHTFVQVFPIIPTDALTFKTFVETEFKKRIVDFTLTPLTHPASFIDVPKPPYIWVCHDRQAYAAPLPPNFPANFLRQTMALWYNLPERGNWKACTDEYSVEERKARELRYRFFKFDSVL